MKINRTLNRIKLVHPASRSQNPDQTDQVAGVQRQAERGDSHALTSLPEL